MKVPFWLIYAKDPSLIYIYIYIYKTLSSNGGSPFPFLLTTPLHRSIPASRTQYSKSHLQLLLPSFAAHGGACVLSTMLSILSSTLEKWLVYHPAILHFEWVPGHTLGSTPLFVFLTLLYYLSLTFLLSRSSLSPLPSKLLKSITAVHSLLLLSLSLIMAVGCSLSILSDRSHLRRAICFPPRTPPRGPLFFWAHVFYLSKLLEFGDTCLIILGGSIRRLSFLHVYHHATVVVMCYLWLRTAQSLFPVALVTNASVHVIMYAYYFLCAVGIRPRWKRVVTDCQIVQFVLSFAVSGWMLYLHFYGSGCSGIWGWCFNAVFNASLLALFVDFHAKSYWNRKEKVKGS